MEFGENIVEERRHDVAGKRQRHMAGSLVLHVADDGRQPGDRAEDFLRLGIKHPPSRRYLEPAAAAGDEPLLQPFFEPSQRIRNRRLLQPEAIGCRRYPVFLHDHQEGPDQVPVEIVRQA